jgi:hypothetical protein
MPTYTVTIDMSQETVNDLAQNNFLLYGFKAVRSSVPGAPLVWFRTNSYGTVTDLNWTQGFQAYTSTSQIVPGGKIRATNSYAADLGQTLEVTGTNGTGTVVRSGTQGAVSVHNLTNTKFTCGISEEQPEGTASPMCAFPLFGNNLDVIAPIAKILLTFSTLPVNTGTVIFQAYSPGLLIDLTGVTSREVQYDINSGWQWGGGAWARQIPANADLVPLLIESSVSLSQEPRTVASDVGPAIPVPASEPAGSGKPEALAGVVNGRTN